MIPARTEKDLIVDIFIFALQSALESTGLTLELARLLGQLEDYREAKTHEARNSIPLKNLIRQANKWLASQVQCAS